MKRLVLPACLAVLLFVPDLALAQTAQPDPQEQDPDRLACTRAGCVPVPRGCQVEQEETYDGQPSGYERIVCPPGVAPRR